MTQEGRQVDGRRPDGAFCKEKNRLLKEFLSAIHELIEIQKPQTQAVFDRETNFARFDVLLRIALERKEDAKYAWITHVESHHCEEA